MSCLLHIEIVGAAYFGDIFFFEGGTEYGINGIKLGILNKTSFFCLDKNIM